MYTNQSLITKRRLKIVYAKKSLVIPGYSKKKAPDSGAFLLMVGLTLMLYMSTFARFSPLVLPNSFTIIMKSSCVSFFLSSCSAVPFLTAVAKL